MSPPKCKTIKDFDDSVEFWKALAEGLKFEKDQLTKETEALAKILQEVKDSGIVKLLCPDRENVDIVEEALTRWKKFKENK